MENRANSVKVRLGKQEANRLGVDEVTPDLNTCLTESSDSTLLCVLLALSFVQHLPSTVTCLIHHFSKVNHLQLSDPQLRAGPVCVVQTSPSVNPCRTLEMRLVMARLGNNNSDKCCVSLIGAAPGSELFPERYQLTPGAQATVCRRQQGICCREHWA